MVGWLNPTRNCTTGKNHTKIEQDHPHNNNNDVGVALPLPPQFLRRRLGQRHLAIITLNFEITYVTQIVRILTFSVKVGPWSFVT